MSEFIKTKARKEIFSLKPYVPGKGYQVNSQGKKYLCGEFEKMGVIIRTGDIFGFPSFIRVTVGTMEENQKFIESLKTILEA